MGLWRKKAGVCPSCLLSLPCLRGLIFCITRFSLYRLCFPAGITPDNFQPSRKPHVIHSYSPFFCFLLVPVFTTGDFPDGNRGCHASHRASCAVSARPFGKPPGSGFPSQAVATSTAGLQHPFRMRRPFYAPYPALSAPRQTDAGL